LEGRWARLAFSAHASNAIDYTRITNNRPETLLVEAATMAEVDRQNLRSLLQFFVTWMAGATHIPPESRASIYGSLLENYTASLMPWHKTAKPAKRAEDQAKDIVEFYAKTIAKARKQRG
jgi:hypothetical protein